MSYLTRIIPPNAPFLYNVVRLSFHPHNASQRGLNSSLSCTANQAQTLVGLSFILVESYLNTLLKIMCGMHCRSLWVLKSTFPLLKERLLRASCVLSICRPQRWGLLLCLAKSSLAPRQHKVPLRLRSLCQHCLLGSVLSIVFFLVWL